MNNQPLKVLLIEDNPGDARLAKELLAEIPGSPFVLDWADGLAAGRKKLSQGEFDVILLDLNLPDSHGLKTFSRIQEAAPSVPIIIKTGLNDEEVAIAAVHQGAQDYLVKGETDPLTLSRTIYYAIERKRSEQALRESEERYRSLFENMLDGFAYCQMLYDDEGRPDDFIYLAANNAFTRLTGLENVVGRKVTEVIPQIKKTNPELFEIYGRVAITGIAETIEVDFKPLEMHLFISVSSPKKGYFAAVFEDIGARKKAEEALTAERDRMEIVMENSPEANLVLLDRDFNFISVNSTYAESCRMTKKEMIGKNHFDLFPDKENEVIFRRVRDTGVPVKLKEKPFEFPGQPWRGLTYWDWSLTPVKDASGTVRALVFSLVDVTEKVRSRQLNEALNDINLVLGSSLDFDEIMRDVMEAAAAALHAESDFLATAKDGEGWVFRYAYGAAADTPVGGPLTADNAPVAAEILKTGETLAVTDAFADDRFDNRVLERLSIYSSIASPLVAKEETIGVIAFRYHSGKVEFGQSEIDFVEKLGASISMALENAKLYRRAQASRTQIQAYATDLAVLHRIGLSLNRETDKTKLLKTMLDGAAEITSAGVGAIIFVGKGKVDLVSMYYAPWYEQRCDIIADSAMVHKRIERLTDFDERDSARISFDDLEKPLELPDGHIELNGLLIGVLRGIRGRMVGYFMMSHKAGGVEFTVEDEEMISLLAAQSSVALISTENFEREHEVADTLQNALLPDIPVRDDLEVGLIYRSASSYSRLGGDFYDFIELDDGRIAVAVGDVCGKGLEAATATAMVKYMLRAYIGDGRSAGNCLTLLNRAVARYIKMEKFVTMGLAMMNPVDESVEYSSAGHPPPIIYRRGTAMLLEFEQAVPLGVLSDYSFKTTRLVAAPDNSLLMYTDGLIEARPPGGEPFGEGKVIEVLGSFNGYPVQRVVERLMEAAVEYSSGNLRDDMAMVAVKFR
ncbi:MAG: SpoIIE family protein phosphatase [Actinobacteria bacterium]|nr:SpoIIE family protein phosphatase [Actinomycetota bacterium]